MTENNTNAQAATKPTCSGTTKAGQPCKTTQLLADGLCRVHSPLSTFDPIESGRKGGRNSGSARRERAKSARDLLRERAEKEMEKIWMAFEGAIDAVNAEGLPDHRARYQAAAALLAEAYGKPVQPTFEQGDGPVIVIEGRPPRGEGVTPDSYVQPGPVPESAVPDSEGRPAASLVVLREPDSLAVEGPDPSGTAVEPSPHRLR